MRKVINRGFTLIELLVVIAIIGILASIVLVSLNGARGKGRDAQRVANLQQAATIINADPNADSASAFTTCVTAHADATTCGDPVLSALIDPSSPAAACGAAPSAVCKFSVSNKAGTGAAKFNDWQVMTYLETGSGPYIAGATCISDSSGGIVQGASCH